MVIQRQMLMDPGFVQLIDVKGAPHHGDRGAANFNGLDIIPWPNHFNFGLAWPVHPMALFGSEVWFSDKAIMPQVCGHPAGG